MAKSGSESSRSMTDFGPDKRAAWRERTHEIIFEADTPAGKLFDLALLITIIASLITVMLESVESFDAEYHQYLRVIDIVITVLFTIEYILRLICVDKPLRYALSFYGIVDMMAIVPGFLSLLVEGTQTLLVIRAVRLLRVFRVFKMSHYLGEARVLMVALKASRKKISVFLLAVLLVTIVMGALMYLLEGPETGFTSIPKGIYWAVVTMTTVGYGDISPGTPLGQAVSAFLMIAGYGIIAVPTGIVTVEMANYSRTVTTRACTSCSGEGHDHDAKFCKHCGVKL